MTVDIHKRTDRKGVCLKRPSAADLIRRAEQREVIWAIFALAVMLIVGWQMGDALSVEARL